MRVTIILSTLVAFAASYAIENDFGFEDEYFEPAAVPQYQAMHSMVKKLTGATDYNRYYPPQLQSPAAQQNHNQAKRDALAQRMTESQKQSHLSQAAQAYTQVTLQGAETRRNEARAAVQQTTNRMAQEYTSRNIRPPITPSNLEFHHGLAQQALARAENEGPATVANFKKIRGHAGEALRTSKDVQQAIDSDPVVRNRPPSYDDEDDDDEFDFY